MLFREADAQPFLEPATIYDSVVSLALPLVTLTPSCLARATISIRFRELTACAILRKDVKIYPKSTIQARGVLTLQHRSCCA